MNVLLESELTETVSVGEGEYVETGREIFVSRCNQGNIEIPCEHRFSACVLERSSVHQRQKRKKYIFRRFNWDFQLRKVPKGS